MKLGLRAEFFLLLLFFFFFPPLDFSIVFSLFAVRKFGGKTAVISWCRCGNRLQTHTQTHYAKIHLHTHLRPSDLANMAAQCTTSVALECCVLGALGTAPKQLNGSPATKQTSVVATVKV